MKLRTLLKRLIIVLLSVSLAGCGKQFVVLRNVPKSPSFVVIPGSMYSNQVSFANEIERAIISAGVKVVARPATKEVITEKALSGAEGIQDSGAQAIRAADAKITERYFAFDAVTADYIVESFANPKQQVKITKRNSNEILAVISPNLTDNELLDAKRTASWWTSAIQKTLKNMGIPVFE